MDIKFLIKQYAKMAVQNLLLPGVYKLCSAGRVEKGLVLFADAHHDSCPFSMRVMRSRVKKIEGVKIKEFYLDFSKCSKLKLIDYLFSFMIAYGRAEYVFICDNFLPVSSCNKRAETTVVQLWHSGGLLKKGGYESEDSIPAFYRGEVFKNYDLMTVSAPACVNDMSRSMHQPDGVTKPTGLSRSDIYFSKKYNERCKKRFYEKYPEAAGKKIVLWAPTFRGTAADPYIVGEEAVDRACGGEEFYLIKKLHPHFHRSGGVDMPPEELFGVADILITDYSSIMFDYLLYDKPFVLFAPDLDSYDTGRGFYVEYDSFPTTIAKTEEELKKAIDHELNHRSIDDLRRCKELHMKSCDGHATERILKEIGLIRSN